MDLIKRASDQAVKAAHPVSNTSDGTPTYRRKMVGILSRRALLAVAKNLELIPQE